MALARIYKSAEFIGAAFAPSFNAACREIEARSGVTVEVLAPVGGARTKKQCNALGTSWTISDHWEGRGRAADINNRGKIIAGLAAREHLTYAQATALYYAIFAKYGWRNITTDGRAFPREPWHLANHDSIPAGTGTRPLPGTSSEPEDDDMPKMIHKKVGTVTTIALIAGSRTRVLGQATANALVPVYGASELQTATAFDAAVAVGEVMLLDEVNAVTAAVVKALPPSAGGASPSAEDIATAVKGALAPDFAAIPPAVIVEQKKPGN